MGLSLVPSPNNALFLHDDYPIFKPKGSNLHDSDGFVHLVRQDWDNPRVTHFGQMLQQLRTSRGLSQQGLADAAGVTLNTIQRGEARESTRSPWKPSTAERVFRALNERAALSKSDTETYLELCGLQALIQQTLALTRQLKAAARPTVERARGLGGAEPTPDATTAHTWLERLLEEAGPVKVLAALEGLAAAWGLDLPPRIKQADSHRFGVWVYHDTITDPETGATAEVYSPHEPGTSERAARGKARKAQG